MKAVRAAVRLVFVASCLSLLAIFGVAIVFPIFNTSMARAASHWITLSIAIVASLYDAKLYYLSLLKSEAAKAEQMPVDSASRKVLSENKECEGGTAGADEWP